MEQIVRTRQVLERHETEHGELQVTFLAGDKEDIRTLVDPPDGLVRVAPEDRTLDSNMAALEVWADPSTDGGCVVSLYEPDTEAPAGAPPDDQVLQVSAKC